MEIVNPVRLVEFRNENFEMWIEDAIFHIVVLTYSFTLDMAEECVRERMRITQGRSYPMLSDSRNVVDFEKGARQYLALKDHTLNLKAGAILIESQLQKVLGNFFLFTNKPDVPARLFTDKGNALAWLEHFKL